MFDLPKYHGLLKPGEIAEKAGILTSKISFYVSRGLLRPAETSESGQKLYDEKETLVQLARIKKLTEKGFLLDEVKKRVATIRNLRRIMIIDDEQDVVDLVSDILKDSFNFDISIAMDGFTAGRMLNTVFPDLIVLDLHLPGINGFELCKKIREDELQTGVKIMAITGFYDAGHASKVVEAGADDLLRKPFDVGEFKNKVFKMLKIKKRKNKGGAEGGKRNENKI